MRGEMRVDAGTESREVGLVVVGWAVGLRPKESQKERQMEVVELDTGRGEGQERGGGQRHELFP